MSKQSLMKFASMKKILIFGDDTRSFLACVRSFGRCGFKVHVAGFGNNTSALYSKYICARHAVPAYFNDGADWLSAIQSLIEQEQFDAILPCDERALLPLALHKNSLPKNLWLGIPNTAALDVFFDKHKTRVLAQTLGISVAKGTVITCDNCKLGSLNLTPPVAVKPISSFSLNSLYSRQEVTLIKSPDELKKLANDQLDGQFLIEEFFEGNGVGLSVLSQNGKIVEKFQHRRCHPESNGGSGYRVSETIDTVLLEAVTKLCAHLQFSGVAMFEFKVAENREKWILLEVNARPWGSLPLAIAAGVDFPLHWYRVSNGLSIEPKLNYKTPLYGRNFQQDLYYVLAKTRREKRLLSKATVLLLWLLGFTRLLFGREHLDALTIDDPKPGIQEIQTLIAKKVSQESSHSADEEKLRLAEILKSAIKLSGKQSPLIIEFVCYGNICRSPFAQAYSEQRAKNFQALNVKFRSSGLLPVEERPSPKNAVLAAQLSGVNLSEHRSNFLSVARSDAADLIIIFDKKIEHIFNSRDTKNSSKLLNLPNMGGLAQIEDPYGKSVVEFENCYGELQKLCDLLLEEVAKTRKFD